jgi:hypothetical protein
MFLAQPQDSSDQQTSRKQDERKPYPGKKSAYWVTSFGKTRNQEEVKSPHKKYGRRQKEADCKSPSPKPASRHFDLLSFTIVLDPSLIRLQGVELLIFFVLGIPTNSNVKPARSEEAKDRLK